MRTAKKQQLMKRKIAFLLFPQIELLDLAGPLQVFMEAQYQGLNLELAYFSYTVQEPVASAAGLVFGPLQHYSEAQLQDGDYLFIPGIRAETFERDLAAEAAFVEWIRRQAAANVQLCSVCNAAFILGEAGLLDKRECTTHWRAAQMLQQQYPQSKVLNDVLYVKSGNIYTSAGISSGIDLALFLVEEWKDAFFAHKVARALVIYHRRNPGDPQHSIYLEYRNHVNAGIHQVQDYLVENMQTSLTIEQLAAMVAMSGRNLSRVFKEHTGITINQYLTLLRIEKAKTLRRNPAYTMEHIAAECGFRSARQLQRILQ